MSKIIRTVRLGGEVVTLGAAERDLHEELEEQSLESIGLEKIIEEQLAELHKGIDGEWENKLRQEKAALRKAAAGDGAVATPPRPKSRGKNRKVVVVDTSSDDSDSDGW